jgi:putative heme utilization carrier protein HutX
MPHPHPESPAPAVQNDPSAIREQVAAILAEDPGEMTPIIARRLGIPEADVLRAFPEGKVAELDCSRWEELIGRIAELGRVHVIASNEGVVLETYGTFGGFSKAGPFFNVQTKDLDMHIKWPELTSAFALIKQSHMDSQMTYSIQFFGRKGQSCFKVFLYKAISGAENVEDAIAVWETMREEFRKG